MSVAMLATVSIGLVAADSPPPFEPTPQAVVAVLDTGINPYHIAFWDDSPRAFEHPSTYLDGFPEDAEALELTFDATDYNSAVRADCELWRNVSPEKVYWFPGTRIVGGIRFGPDIDPNCSASRPVASILDANGHGTMTASRVGADVYGACPDCLIVAVQSPMTAGLNTPPELAAVEWMGDNANWIDAQSNSWGPIVPVYDPSARAGLFGASPALIETAETAAQKHLAFWASGNGAAFRGGVLGHPTLLSPQLTPSVISVGGHDSGYVNIWPGFWPHLVSDSCDAWGAHDDSYYKQDDSVSGGTSGATPFVAGGAGAILLDARRLLGDVTTGVRDGVVAAGDPGAITTGPLADGEFTLDEWRRVLMTTATERPERQFEDGPPCGITSAPYNELPVKWVDVPDAYPEYINIGYGAVDRPSLALASEVLRGTAATPDRSDTDTFFMLDDAARSALFDVWTLPGS